VSFNDVARDACDFHLIHWMGSISPSPSWFCVRPLFAVYAFLWSAVGRRAGRWMAPDYHRAQGVPRILVVAALLSTVIRRHAARPAAALVLAASQTNLQALCQMAEAVDARRGF
jgi:hypothetical protein